MQLILCAARNTQISSSLLLLFIIIIKDSLVFNMYLYIYEENKKGKKQRKNENERKIDYYIMNATQRTKERSFRSNTITIIRTQKIK